MTAKLGIYRVTWKRRGTEEYFRARDHSHARSLFARIIADTWDAKFSAVLVELRAIRAAELDGLFAPADTYVGALRGRFTPAEIVAATEAYKRSREKVPCGACGAMLPRGERYPYPGHKPGCGVQRQARLRDEAAYREAMKSA